MGRRKKSTEVPPLLAALETIAEVALTEAICVGWKKWMLVYLERGISPAQATKLGTAASALEKMAHIAGLFPVKNEKVFRILSRALAECNIKEIPKNWRRLAEMCAAVLAGTPIPDLIRPKNVGNQNARKHPAKPKTRARLDDGSHVSDPPKTFTTP